MPTTQPSKTATPARRVAATSPAGETVRKAPGGRPTREAAAQLERRILAVAAELFAAQGYAATSMEQVAEICKAGKDTLYRRYASKAAPQCAHARWGRLP